jgi:hypothetical protein
MARMTAVGTKRNQELRRMRREMKSAPMKNPQNHPPHNQSQSSAAGA